MISNPAVLMLGFKQQLHTNAEQEDGQTLYMHESLTLNITTSKSSDVTSKQIS
jgi:hypothetical protein